MKKFEKILLLASILSFSIALFQAIIGFSPSLSLYFGAPEAFVKNIHALIIVSCFVAGILAVFGLYALSGSGRIRPLPLLKQVLALISCIYILRGLLLVPEFLVVTDVFHISIPVTPRFILFSVGSLLIGLVYLIGTIGVWNKVSS